MSTRCQVQVVEEWSDLQEMETLYRHSDGYPDYMIPLIYRAWIKANDEYFPHPVGRAAVVVEMLWWAGRREFKWECSHHLHGDIRYYYRLHCWYSNREERPVWEIDVYERNCSFFENDLTLAYFKLLENRQRIENLITKY